MAQERVVKVTLEARMQGYIDGVNKAAKATRELGTEGEKLAQTKQAFDLLGKASLAAGGLLAAGLGLAVTKFVEFDQAMSNVQAATHETSENMALLREAALDAGASTVYSATEAANAIEELSKAGVSTADILGGALAGSLDLAAAGGIGVARAAEVASVTLKQFNLEGTQTGHVADLLAAGAGKAVGGVEDIAQALNQSGLVAAQFGISVEETVGTLAAFAENSLLGSDAGTSFRTMLLRLANPTDEVKTLMKDLGIEAYDTSGQFVGIAGLAGELETALAGMTDEQKQSTLAMIFGQDAIRSSSILLKEGERGIRDWTAAVDDQGYAADTAATKLDNLAGDWEALSGATETALISMGSAADGPLRGFVQGLTGLVDKFNELPDGAKQAAFWVGAVGGAAAIAFGSYLLLVPKVAEFKSALDVLGPSASRAARGITAVGAAVGGVLAGAAIASAGGDLLIDFVRGLGQASEVTANKVKTAANAVELIDGAAANLTGQSSLKIAEAQVKALGAALDGDRSVGTAGAFAINTIDKLGGELGKLAQTDLPAAQEQFRLLAEGADLSAAQQFKLLERMGPYKKALTEQATESNRSADSQSLLADAMGESATATEENVAQLETLQGVAVDTETDVNALADSIRNFGTTQFDTEQASLDFEKSLRDLSATLTDGDGNLVGSLDKTTEAGGNTLNAMLDVAQSTNDYAASVAAMGGSTEQVQGILEAGRQKIIETRLALGDTEEQARQYADQLIATPDTIATAVQLTGVTEAENTLNTLARQRYATIRTAVGPGVAPAQGLDRVFASGGAVDGPGTATSDSIPAWLSKGEHVLTASDVARMGGQHAVYGFRQALQSGGGFGNSAPTAVYVQNPWTGEYMLAKTAEVASGVVSAKAYQDGVSLSGGKASL